MIINGISLWLIGLFGLIIFWLGYFEGRSRERERNSKELKMLFPEEAEAKALDQLEEEWRQEEKERREKEKYEQTKDLLL